VIKAWNRVESSTESITFYPLTANPDQFTTFLTAMLMVEQDTQKTYLQRNQQLHSLMDPFINWVPTQDFRGEIVEYGPLIQLHGCDPHAPKIPCGNQRDLGLFKKKTDQTTCARYKCCWDIIACSIHTWYSVKTW
jgi:hypothetical protein